jgi:hypothetical protein
MSATARRWQESGSESAARRRLPTTLVFGSISPDCRSEIASSMRAISPLASDDHIWEFAQVNGFCVVTQDSDFAERSRLYGAPPKVVWLRCDNSTPQQIGAISAGTLLSLLN